MIRTENFGGCPFGLPIPKACSCVGEAIHQMEEGGNNQLQNGGAGCPFAVQLNVEKGFVNCNYGDSTEGQKEYKPTGGNPAYFSIMDAGGGRGFNSPPIGLPFTNQNDSSGGPSHSFSSKVVSEGLLRIADTLDKKGLYVEADQIESILRREASKEQARIVEMVEKLVTYLGGWDSVGVALEKYFQAKAQPGQRVAVAFQSAFLSRLVSLIKTMTGISDKEFKLNPLSALKMAREYIEKARESVDEMWVSMANTLSSINRRYKLILSASMDDEQQNVAGLAVQVKILRSQMRGFKTKIAKAWKEGCSTEEAATLQSYGDSLDEIEKALESKGL